MADAHRRLLVVGAKPGSIGAGVAATAKVLGVPGWGEVVTAGISGEDLLLDFKNPLGNANFLKEFGAFHDVVCTVGINVEGGVLNKVADSLFETDLINYHGHIYLLQEWVAQWIGILASEDAVKPLKNWVSISSNSAHIARSPSLAYCASKAALSMAIRCAGRELAHAGLPFNVYAYEPGWVDDTPMSVEAEERLTSEAGGMMRDPVLHRIPGGKGLDMYDLAGLIVHNLRLEGRMFNGTCIRVDGGEQ